MWEGSEIGSRAGSSGLRKRMLWLPRVVARGGGKERGTEEK